MRLIDADTLFDFLTDQLEIEVGFYSKGRNAGINIARSALHDETITPTIAPPPNDPLTLEELREMEGEPVYLIDKTDPVEEEWVIWDSHWTENWIETDAENYGKSWTAYRRKPEEDRNAET